MPTAVTEFMDKGIVTARHPTLLAPGELQLADECVYRENDPAIHSAPGRTIYNATAFASKIKGHAHVTFDGDRDDYLLAHVGTTMYASVFSALTGSFSEIGTSGQVAGTVATDNDFTATTGYPFLADIVGAHVFGVDYAGARVPLNCVVTAVSGQDGSTGHYNVVELSTNIANGATTLSFSHGTVGKLSNQGTEILSLTSIGNDYVFTTGGSDTPQKVAWRSRAISTNNTVLPEILMFRPLGLNPVIRAHSVKVNTGRPTGWNALLGGGYYWFIVTEIYAPNSVMTSEGTFDLDKDYVESAYMAPDPNATDSRSSIGRPIPTDVALVEANLASTTITITFPAVTNTGFDGRIATHWGIYMSDPTDDPRTIPSLAAFRRVAVRPITDTSYELTDKQLTQLQYPTQVTSYGTRPAFANETLMLGPPDYLWGGSWSGSSAPDVVSPGVFPAYNDGDSKEAQVKLYTYPFVSTGAYATASIVGLEVQVRGFAGATLAGHSAGYAIKVISSTKETPWFFGEFKMGLLQMNYHGGPLDTLGPSSAWSASDLASLAVIVYKTGTGASQRLAIESVGVKIYFTGTTINLDGAPYRVVTYRSQIGTTVHDPVNLPPPNHSLSCVHGGCLVTDNKGVNGQINWSLPDRYEAFPKPYQLTLISAKRDVVTHLSSLGQILVAGLRENIRRINYLPTEFDTDFSQSMTVQEPLADDHGIAGSKAAAKFDFPGAGTMLFYISTVGPRLTDGITTRPANVDLKWDTTVNLSYLSTSVVEVNAKNKWIIFYYCPYGATHGRNTRALIFSYDTARIKAGGYLPAIGPITVSGRSVCGASLNGFPYVITSNEALFKLYVEDNGDTIPSGYTVASADGSAELPVYNVGKVKTRRFYPAGIGRDAREEKLYLLFSATGLNQTMTANFTLDSATINGTFGEFGAYLKPGMLVVADYLPPGTIVLSVPTANQIIVSNNAVATVSDSTLQGKTCTVRLTVRGNDLNENIRDLDSSYVDLTTGDLVVAHNDNMKQAMELQIDKVYLPDGSPSDIGVPMRLHHFTYSMSDVGTEISPTP